MPNTMDSIQSHNKEPQAMTLVIDRSLTIVWADPAAVCYFGPHIVHRPCHEILHSPDEPCDRCVVRECFDDGKTHVCESEVLTKEDFRRVLKRTARPAEFRPDGILQFVKEIIEDITPQRVYEKTMREAGNQGNTNNGRKFLSALVPRLCQIFQAHWVFVGTFNPDRTRVRTVASAVGGEPDANFTYPLSSAPCRHLLDRTSHSHPRDAAAQYPQCEWMHEKAVSGYAGVQLRDSREKPVGIMAALFREKIEDPALVEALMNLFAQPMAAALEQVVNRQILDEYRHIAASSNDMLALLDHRFVYQIVNRAYAAFHGLPTEQIVGRPMPEVVGTDFFNAAIRPAAEECLQGTQNRLQIWHPSDNHSPRCLDMTFYPHYEKGASQIKGFVLCAKDITRNKKLEADLRQASKMEAIGRLSAGIVHDFNNILGAVVGYTDLALNIVSGQPEVTQYLKEIQQAGLRATELVKQILAFSRQNNEARKPIQPRVVLKEALRLLRATIPADIVIRTVLESKAYILADPIHLHQIVINLCTNAQHAMRDHGGTLSVELKDVLLTPAEAGKDTHIRPGAYIRMIFADTGHGIPAAVQAKMFDPFFTTKGKGEGTGMGLAMVESIVKSYHGKIDLISEVGRGTTIEIRLPVIEAGREPESTGPSQLPQGEGQRILVVDDERKLAEVSGAMLKSLGYRVRTETDSRRALDLFKANPGGFDLLLSDVSMPGMSGDALAREVMALRPDIPVILMTGHNERLNPDLIRRLRIRKLLSKPLPLNVLAASVREVLDSSLG